MADKEPKVVENTTRVRFTDDGSYLEFEANLGQSAFDGMENQYLRVAVDGNPWFLTRREALKLHVWLSLRLQDGTKS